MGAEPGEGAAGALSEGSLEASQRGRALALSLVSHTNVGKTTLARTLLRRDIGDVLDQAHVTAEDGRHTLVETAAGERLELWDTPGFGDSTRLAQLLREREQPFEWLLAQPFDPERERPLWCSQVALRNVLERADLVLYLVNASEHPADAGYVGPEMELLQRAAKPVLLVLNQTGPPREAEQERADAERWLRHLSGHAVVRGALALDAFARCWVQEGLLLERCAEFLPPDRRALAGRLLAAWRARQIEVFEDSQRLLAGELRRAALDQESLEEGGFGNNRKKAMASLRERMVEGMQSSVTRLIALHGLEGRAAVELETATLDFSHSARELDPRKASLWGAIGMGVTGGLAGDLSTGGLTLGGGALLGGLLGAAGGIGLARAYRVVQGEERPRVSWSSALLERSARELLLRYLAVSHYGRGRGAWRDREPPRHWREVVERALKVRGDELRSALRALRDPGPGRVEGGERLAPLLRGAARDALVALYPDCGVWLPP